MSKIISNPKTYTGQELTQTFFRPLLQGDSAEALGIRVIYNMPVPTTLNFWKQSPDALVPYSKGWNGSNNTERFQKTIELSKVKAEMSYAAADYFSMVYEQIVGRSDVDLNNLSGTELEAAETELFRQCIAESIRATMWIGDTERDGSYSTFDGLLKKLYNDRGTEENEVPNMPIPNMTEEDSAETLFGQMYSRASDVLKQSKKDGNLAFFVTGDVYENYEKTLLSGELDSARSAKISGIEQLFFLGIPVINMGIDSYLLTVRDLPRSCAILTDKRNLTLAVNTADFPGSQISMWYNEDELENRQRAIFMAGCDYLLPELVFMAANELP